MLDKVKRTIEEYGMLKEGEAVLCGLSGGADSVTLLLCLCELGYAVSAVHVNHRLRGAEADVARGDAEGKGHGKIAERDGDAVLHPVQKGRFPVLRSAH